MLNESLQRLGHNIQQLFHIKYYPDWSEHYGPIESIECTFMSSNLALLGAGLVAKVLQIRNWLGMAASHVLLKLIEFETVDHIDGS